MIWVSQYVEGKQSGFDFFLTYVNPANGFVLGWIGRLHGSTEYLIYYFLGQTGQGLAQDTRGAVRHAMDAIDGIIKREGVIVGIYQMDIPKLTTQILAANKLHGKTTV